MRQKKNTRFLVFAIFTVVTVSLWSFTSIWRAVKKAEPPDINESELADLDPVLDMAILDEVETRLVFEEQGEGAEGGERSLEATESAGAETGL